MLLFNYSKVFTEKLWQYEKLRKFSPANLSQTCYRMNKAFTLYNAIIMYQSGEGIHTLHLCNVDINPAIRPSLLYHNIPSNLVYLIVSSLCCISLNWCTTLIKNCNILDSTFVKSPHKRRKERLRIINRPALYIVVMNINLALIFKVT